MPTTRVYSRDRDDENKQYMLTVPAGIAEALDLEGEDLEWDIQSRNTIELHRE